MIPVQKMKLYDETGEVLESLPGPIRLQEIQKPQSTTKTSVQGPSMSINIKRFGGTLYHKDGNLVLVADDPSLQGPKTFDGCPVIPVYNSVEDLTLFLGVMYGYTPILNISVNSDEFWTLLKFATKYVAFGIRRSCIKMISQAGYAVTFKDYDSNTTRPGLSSRSLNALQEANQTDAFTEQCRLENDALMRLYRGKSKLAKIWPEFVAKEIVKRAENRKACCRPIFKQAFDAVSHLMLDANITGFVAPLLYHLRHQADMSFGKGL
ncbi:hypothetical protein M422DRAFT_251803 [Sphaerobolus stellatus SS14]|uniref:Uncharacterized protein n=1 Tax=Sphaerobolus stellatus (strain SS14) TaxID=990650 RepID=A0A0C9UPG6_SPHS4|nr:hypothetical protein M422DRAFT_251803 [Sphaerobolus stellatus SS14]